MSKKKSHSRFDFKAMSFFFKIRDFFKDPMDKVSKTDVKKGDYILEYGCGPGSFTIPLAELVGRFGKVYAADIHPLSSEKVQEKAEKHDLHNIETIKTECKTGLEENSIDTVILIDVLHDLEEYEENLKEFHRVLKPHGNLWVDDHHYDLPVIKQKIANTKLFKFIKRVDSLFEFQKI